MLQEVCFIAMVDVHDTFKKFPKDAFVLASEITKRKTVGKLK